MRVISCAIAFGIIVLLGACAGQAADEAGEAGGAAGTELRITVEGIRSAHGTVLIGLYDSAVSFDRAIELAANDGFLNDPQRVAGIALKANAAMMSGVALPNLPPGRYGAIVFQDENGNGRLDKNFWGVPTEPYGFSNNVQGALGPPSFAAVAMTLDGSDKAISIALIYHGGGHSVGGSGEPRASSSASR